MNKFVDLYLIIEKLYLIEKWLLSGNLWHRYSPSITNYGATFGVHSLMADTMHDLTTMWTLSSWIWCKLKENSVFLFYYVLLLRDRAKEEGGASSGISFNRRQSRNPFWNCAYQWSTYYLRCIHRVLHPFEWPDRFRFWTWLDHLQYAIRAHAYIDADRFPHRPYTRLYEDADYPWPRTGMQSCGPAHTRDRSARPAESWPPSCYGLYLFITHPTLELSFKLTLLLL